MELTPWFTLWCVRDRRSDLIRAGELAEQSGVSKDTLRYYERAGLLPAPRRLENGYRSYSAEALARVRLIRAALSIGFTVAELSKILACRDRGESPCADVRRLAGEKLDRLAADLRELKVLRSELERVLVDWDRRMAVAGPGKRAGLLDSLADARTRGQIMSIARDHFQKGRRL
jgi:DNA-binding transcriptional MerR regulator